MATLEYAVSNQEIATTKTAELVKNTIGFYTVKFTFTGSVWTGLSERWAVFDPDIGESYKTPLDGNGECSIPGEVMSANSLLIGVYGVTDGIEYPTIWTNRKWLKDGAYEDCPVSDYPEPSPVIETLQEEIDELTAGKVDKPENATEGNVAIFGSNSNIADSGVSKDNLILAPQLASNNIKTDSIPYVYRQTGGGIGVGNREYDSIVGGSIVHNQLLDVRTASTTVNDITASTADGVVTVTGTASANADINLDKTTPSFKANHVYYFKGVNGGSASTFSCFLTGTSGSGAYGIVMYMPSILKATAGRSEHFRLRVLSGVTVNIKFAPKIIDLTEEFGSTVADRIFTLYGGANTGTAEPFIESIGQNGIDPYTATPSLESVSGLSSHQMKDGNGDVIAEYPLDDSLTLRGVAVIDENNNIAFDGDLYHSDGTVDRRYGIVDLGTLTWTWWEAQSLFYAYLTGMDTTLATRYLNLCDKYVRADNLTAWSDVQDKHYVRGGTNNIIHIRDSSYSTAAELKTALSGHYLLYVLATPTTETAIPYDALQICDPLGTEQYVTTGIVPVGHITQYPEDAVKKLSGLPSDFSTLIAPTEVTYKATRAYTTGRLLIVNNVLYKATTSIASGATLTVGTNIVATTLDEVIASL